MASREGSRLIKNSVLTLFNTFFMLTTTWVISIWVARQLGPANYGIFNLVLWVTGTVTWAVGMGLIHAVTKFVAEYNGRGEKECLRPIIMFVLRVELMVSAVATILLLVFQSQIADFFFSPKETFFFFLAFLGLIPGILTAVFSSAIEGIQKFEFFTYANLIITPLAFACKIWVLVSGQGINGLLIVMLVTSFVNALFYFIVLVKEGVFTTKSIPLAKDIKHRIGAYNRSVIAILLCDKIVWDKSENFFLGRFCSAAEIGYYNLGYNVAQKFISILPMTFWKVLFPAMSTYFGAGDRNKMKRLFFLSTRYLAFVAFPMGAAGTILAYQIIHFMYGHEYIGAQRVLQIVFSCSILSSLSNPASAVLYGFEKQAFIYRYGAVLAVVNLTLDFFLIKKYGALGAAICYGITTVLGSVGGLIYTCKTMRLKYPIVSVFKIVFATIIMGTVMEIIILQNGELPGFILAIFAGIVVYLICSLVLGTFESEDYAVLGSFKAALPGKLKTAVDSIIEFISAFKHSPDGPAQETTADQPETEAQPPATERLQDQTSRE
jgi:stage V sporulation protein B